MSRAIALEVFFPIHHIDTIGEQESLQRSWKNWKVDVKFYITASGISNTNEERLQVIWKSVIELHKAMQGRNHEVSRRNVC